MISDEAKIIAELFGEQGEKLSVTDRLHLIEHCKPLLTEKEIEGLTVAAFFMEMLISEANEAGIKKNRLIDDFLFN